MLAVTAAVCTAAHVWRSAAEHAELSAGAQSLVRVLGIGAATPMLVLLPVFDRPAYLNETLASLRACAGVRDVVLVASVDGDDAAVAALVASAAAFTRVVTLRHTRPLLMRALTLVTRTDGRAHCGEPPLSSLVRV